MIILIYYIIIKKIVNRNFETVEKQITAFLEQFSTPSIRDQGNNLNFQRNPHPALSLAKGRVGWIQFRGYEPPEGEVSFLYQQ